MHRRIWALGVVFILALSAVAPIFSHSVFAAAPDVVTGVVPTTADQSVTLSWATPASVDFNGTMVRYSTSTFPATISDGTLAADVAGIPNDKSSITVNGLVNGTVYYFSLFSHNAALEYSAAVNTQQLVMPTAFSEDFESRSLTGITGQNGWVAIGGTWTVIDTAGEQTLQSSSAVVAYEVNRVLNGGSVSTHTDQMVRVDWKGSTTATPGQVFLRAQSASADAGGYFMWQSGGTVRINYKTASGPAQVQLASAAFTPVAGTWYTYEFSVVNNAAGLPVLTGYVWARGTAKPPNPTLQVTDTINRFPQGVFSLGKTGASVNEYDNVTFSGRIGVSRANVTPGNLSNTISWTNPTYATYAGTMVRASTVTYPTSISDGTLVEDVAGTSAGTSSAVHTGLTNGTVYYYTLFPYDNLTSYGTPMRLTQIAYPYLFTDNFNALTTGTIVGQNGWSVSGGTWDVADVSSERVLSGTATATTYPTNKAINGGAETTDQILYSRFKSNNSSNTAGYVWLRYQLDGSGYLVWHNANAWNISYVSGGVLTTLATAASTAAPPMEANVWFNQEVSVVNNGSELPVINIYIWKDGAQKPITPTLTATDSSDRFVQGSFALGRNQNNAVYYDDVSFFGDGPALSITSPAASVPGDPDVATLAIVDADGTFYVPYIQTSTTLSVTASAGAVSIGGGVEFVLNEGLGSEQSFIDLSSPYGGSFVGLEKGEYTLDAYVLDSDGVTRLVDAESHDTRTDIGIGDIITVIGDSIVEGFHGTIDGGTVTSWLDGDAGTVSADERNFPQYGPSTAAYAESYLTDLNDSLSAYYGYPVFLMNEGHGGIRADTYLSTDMAVAAWQNRQNALDANKWIVALGNNDANVGHSAATYEADMTALLDVLVNTYGAQAESIFVPYPFYDFRPCNPGCGTAAEYIETYLPVIDELRATYDLSDGPDLFNTFQNYQATEYFDTVHPNATGYVRMARLWEMAFMKPVLEVPVVSGRSVSLAWDDLAAFESAIVGYRINYGTDPANLDQSVTVGNVIATTISNLNWATTYYFSVEGFDNDPTDLSYTDDSDVQTATTGAGTSAFTVSAISGNTTEAGGAATFTVVLTSQPVADVTVAVSSSDTTEGTVLPATLTFTTADWDNAAAHTVTVTGVNDDVDDGDIAYNIVLAAAVSTDITYNGVDPADRSLSNVDNDTAGITVSAVSGDTTEVGGQATFTIVLDSEPTADVSIGFASSNTNEGTASPVAPPAFTFTSVDWDEPQTVTITGVDDNIDDGNISYDIVINASVSGDPLYDAVNPADVTLANTDDDTAGITVSAVSGDTSEAGTQATFTIVLDSEPTNDVTISLSSSDVTEGTIDLSLLTFTSADWDQSQLVTITGVNDDVADGNIAYSVLTVAAVSDDPNYDGINPSNPSLSNTDDDTANVLVTQSEGQTTVTEGGGTDSYTLVLTSEPTADVVITLSPDAQVTVDSSPITFTAGDWDIPQTVTVGAVDDFVAEGAHTGSITHVAVSVDPTYDGMAISSVVASISDNDTAGIAVSMISGNTTEAGGTATFTVALTSEPTADVTIELSSSSDSGEGTIDPITLVFTDVDWDDVQTVTVTGVNDDVDDGDVAYFVILAAAASADEMYNNINPDDVAVTNTDDDTVGVIVVEAGGTTEVEEGEENDTYTVVLTSEPTNDVVVSISFEGLEVAVDDATLTFTSADWSVAQTVTVMAVNDSSYERDETVIIIHTVSSEDPLYDGIVVDSVSVNVIDDDPIGSNKTPVVGGGGGSSGSGSSRSITILAPVGSDVFDAGDEVAVEWTWTGTIPYVNIDLRLEATDDWVSLLTNGTNIGFAEVRLPNAGSSEVQMRVVGTDLADTLASAISDTFTIEGDDAATDQGIQEVAARVDALPSGVSVHGLVKLPNDGDSETQFDSAVYYVGADGRRHVFPNDEVYFTWFCDFSAVQLISAEDLATIPLGSNVTYRPGTRLVKFVTNAKVYAVDQFGVLRWVTSEELARELYGPDWNQLVDDISDAFFSNYTFGGDITSEEQYSRLSAEESVTYPSDNFLIPGYEATTSAGLVCPA